LWKILKTANILPIRLEERAQKMNEGQTSSLMKLITFGMFQFGTYPYLQNAPAIICG
jgi:hypothetical protein